MFVDKVKQGKKGKKLTSPIPFLFLGLLSRETSSINTHQVARQIKHKKVSLRVYHFNKESYINVLFKCMLHLMFEKVQFP